MNYLTLAACAVVVALLFMLSLNASAVVGEASFQARKRVDYTKFSHSTHTLKQKLSCDSCHKFPTANWKDVRKGDAAFPDVTEFSEHATCLNCHRQQFFARQRPAPAICSNCHINATPRNTARFVFPSLGASRDFVSEFHVAFPHEKHEDAECSDCHEKDPPEQRKPLKHALCFSCHNQESELAPLPPNCNSCHQPRE